jgi:sugar phosphate isomerase/epimerase
MKTLLNISTHESDLKYIGKNWETLRSVLNKHSFHGVELYHIGSYRVEKIPKELITGMHLVFFVIVEPMWNGNKKRLLEIFDTEENIQHFYGGPDRDSIVETYRKQLDAAQSLGCEYVVFHPAHCELEYVYQWDFPWSWQQTIRISAHIINEVMRYSRYRGQILFENLWWPGSFRLDGREEIEFLMDSTEYNNCGIMLDTGHLLNKDQSLRSEAEGIRYILSELKKLQGCESLIRGVHLSKSLSAEYVNKSRTIKEPYREAFDFWERFDIARRHAENIDRHDAFRDRSVGNIFDYIAPEYLVFEFNWGSLKEWHTKIAVQKRALGPRFYDLHDEEEPIY